MRLLAAGPPCHGGYRLIDSFSKKERAFVSKLDDPARARACIALATAFNRLDASIIESHLAEEISYGSQETLDDLCGKAEVMDYITAKFETLREGGLTCRIRAELALDPLDGRPSVLLYQRRNGYEAGFGEPVGYAALELDGKGQIHEIFLASVAPSPDGCSRTGLFPGLTTDQVARDRKPPRVLLRPEASLALKLFIMSGSGLCAEMERSVASLCEKQPNWRLDVVWLGHGLDPEPEAMAYHILGFPTLVVEYDGEECCRISGIQEEEMIAERIAQLSESGAEGLD